MPSIHFIKLSSLCCLHSFLRFPLLVIRQPQWSEVCARLQFQKLVLYYLIREECANEFFLDHPWFYDQNLHTLPVRLEGNSQHYNPRIVRSWWCVPAFPCIVESDNADILIPFSWNEWSQSMQFRFAFSSILQDLQSRHDTP